MSHDRRGKAGLNYCAITMGARQKAAFPVDGSSTVTWQSYRPGLRLAALTLKLSGVTPRRVAGFGVTAIGCVLNASAPLAYRVTNAITGCAGAGGTVGVPVDGCGGRRFVGLQVNVDVAIPIEDSGYAGHELFAILNERVDRIVFGAVFGLGCIVDCVFQLDALAAENDGTDGNAFVFLVQIGNDEVVW